MHRLSAYHPRPDLVRKQSRMSVVSRVHCKNVGRVEVII
jgi:hypothetical protein